MGDVQNCQDVSASEMTYVTYIVSSGAGVKLNSFTRLVSPSDC